MCECALGGHHFLPHALMTSNGFRKTRKIASPPPKKSPKIDSVQSVYSMILNGAKVLLEKKNPNRRFPKPPPFQSSCNPERGHFHPPVFRLSPISPTEDGSRPLYLQRRSKWGRMRSAVPFCATHTKRLGKVSAGKCAPARILMCESERRRKCLFGESES